MLFLLTGEIQTGKTRWLLDQIEALIRAGAPCAGVVAPGVWRERSAEEGDGPGGAAGLGRFEKLGIDNVLLPGGERVAFAHRSDLAVSEGSFDAASQSAAAQLAWSIDDAAIGRVNAHFDRLAAEDAPALIGEGAHVSAAWGALEARAAGSAARESDDPASYEGLSPSAALLVVDELGRLELMRGCGLTSAMALLESGPSARFPHALVVVRAGLVERAERMLGPAWGGAERIYPNAEGARRLFEATACSRPETPR